MSEWQPPETAPKNGTAFLITTAGPQMDICAWVKERNQFEDYFHKQRIAQKWPYMVAWKPIGEPAHVGDSEIECSRLNGWR